MLSLLYENLPNYIAQCFIVSGYDDIETILQMTTNVTHYAKKAHLANFMKMKLKTPSNYSSFQLQNDV